MKFYGLLGDERVYKSLSPVMFESIFSALGHDGRYVVFNIDRPDVHKAVHAVKVARFSGVNVTTPHKESVIPHLDGLDECARAVGAVNTIVFNENAALGFNTDIGGFGDLLDYYRVVLKDSHVVIVGGGGATRAVLYALLERGCKLVSVVNRTYVKSKELVDRIGGTAIKLEEAGHALKECTLMVNTTSISEIHEASAFFELFSGERCFEQLRTVIDINYGRKTNFWAQLAHDHGADFVDGLFMLAAQAKRSFHLWTGETVSIDHFLQPLGFRQ